MQDNGDLELPILAYYGAGRLWDTHRNILLGKPGSRGAGYRNCLDPKSDHFLFVKWFKQLETVAIQRRKTIPAMEMIRQAVKNCIPGAQDFFYDAAHDALMIVLADQGHQRFDQLSDGYRNTVAMVADIAHRAIRLNPQMGVDASRRIEGVVLIDEIDLHLHPHWQRRIVRDLQRIFPKIQFIATTHSPFILQSLDPGEVKNCGGTFIADANTMYATWSALGPEFAYSMVLG